jgi:hypothetical protein
MPESEQKLVICPAWERCPINACGHRSVHEYDRYRGCDEGCERHMVLEADACREATDEERVYLKLTEEDHGSK